MTRVKVEEVYKRPQIVLIHKFLSEKEIELMKNISKPHLSNRKSAYGESNGDEYTDSASYEIYYFEDNKNQLSVITRRIGAIIRYTMQNPEIYRILKYSVGGGATSHHDSLFNNTLNDKRIATWINYLSDVEAGGSTYFPRLNISVKPKKSSALFWYSLKKSGELDLETFHGSCPVLIGTKLVAVIPIYMKGQELTKPCSLNKHDHNSL